jgi:hypothetical protein
MKLKKTIYVNNILFYIIIALILLYFIFSIENIRVNLIVFSTLKRGIITQNCFWWKLNDYLPDATGTEVYSNLKLKGRFVKLNIFGEHIYLLTDIRDIQQLLDLSPNPFGPGKIKKNFFDTFIPNNVVIAVNPDWKYKREYNDIVLETDRTHKYNEIFASYIEHVFKQINPKNFNEFTEATKKITSQIIFGSYNYNSIIYEVFAQANSFFSAIFNINTVNSDTLHKYYEYLQFELENPKPYTLIALANMHHKMLPTNLIMDQIPHWIFPIAGLFSSHLPRLLVILANHPHEFEKVLDEINNKKYYYKDNYIRKCILELFRLNNAVNSTFRGLSESFTFNNSSFIFQKGTQFVFFNNPILREHFDSPNEYIPSRWNVDIENSYAAVMFNHGNQRCPGKELVISLLTSALIIYLNINNNIINTNIKINPSFIPYTINPCTITFYST